MRSNAFNAVCVAVFALIMTACSGEESTATQDAASADVAKALGFDPAELDDGVKPGDDFFAYVNGKWIAENEIPADRSRYGAFDILRDKSDEDVKAIIEEASAKENEEGSDQQRVGDLYLSFQDFETRNAKGISPLDPYLVQIDGLTSKDEVFAFFGVAARLGFNAPVGLFAYADAKNPGINTMYLSQGGIGLPEREYYFKDDAKSEALREQYKQLIADIHAMAGWELDAETIATIYGVEETIAQAHMTKEATRNFANNYTRYEQDELTNLVPDVAWDAFLGAFGLPEPGYLVSVTTPFFEQLGPILDEITVDDWKHYLRWQLLNSQASRLSRDLDNRNFEFYGKALRGSEEQRPDWKRAVGVVDAGLGELVGKVYVEKHFPPEAKARMDVLVANLVKAYQDSVKALDWMSEETKAEALDKLSKFEPKIGYPKNFRAYEGVTIARDDYFGNLMRIREADVERDISRHGGPVDRDEWGMNPQTVNAYYTPVLNQIVFPAAILQPPFFDLAADEAINYGAIGAVIGHEIGHGVDDQGSKFDGDGNIRNWWTDADRAEFEARTDALVGQYDSYYPFPDLHVNGTFTLGENIGDLGGISIALKAYQASLQGQEAPIIGGFSGTQRVFIGFGRVWRSKIRDEALRTQIATDPHSPGVYRANGSVRNVPEWYSAFQVSEGDGLYLAPEERVKIW
ncbi:MAG: M13-type metalloendopeptidase [Halieaceae bacterium]|jgi:putative endopeptidase